MSMSVEDVASNTHRTGNGRVKYVFTIHISAQSCPSISIFKGRDLSGLLEAMQDQFSREPPVYAKPKNEPVRPQSSQSVSISQPPTNMPSDIPPNDRPLLPPKPGPSAHLVTHT